MRRSRASPLFTCFRRAPIGDPVPPIVVFLASLGTASAILLVSLPGRLVLPALSLCAIIAASAAALASLRAGAAPSNAARDLAGAFAIVGCAATILGEIEPVLEFIGQGGARSKAHD